MMKKSSGKIILMLGKITFILVQRMGFRGELSAFAGYAVFAMQTADTRTLRLKSKLFDLRVGYVNRHSLRCALRNRVQIHGLRLQRKEKMGFQRESHFSLRRVDKKRCQLENGSFSVFSFYQ